MAVSFIYISIGSMLSGCALGWGKSRGSQKNSTNSSRMDWICIRFARYLVPKLSTPLPSP